MNSGYRMCCRAIMLLAMSLIPAGCFSYSPAEGPRVAAVESASRTLEWPAGDVVPLEAIKAATPERLFRARTLPGAAASDVKEPGLKELLAKPSYTIIRSEIVDGTLIRVYRREDAWPGLSFLFNGFVPSGYVLVPSDVSGPAWVLGKNRSARLRESVNKSWAASGVEMDPTGDDVGIDQGIPFRIPETLPEGCRGVVLHLWALGGNEYERDVAEKLAEHGWLVVDVKPRTTAVGEVEAATVEKILDLDQKHSELSASLPKALPGESPKNYQRRVRASEAYKKQREIQGQIVELRNPPLKLCIGEDIGDTAGAIAARIDRVLGENAAATRAVLETTRRMHPSLQNAPVAVVGFSAGALSTPTVAAMLGPEVDAVVIVGGAANMLGVATRSVVSKGGIRLMCDGKAPDKALLQKLTAAYLEKSRLDAYHAAPYLADRPVLVVDAGMDTWVPSDLGEILYERLGRPERLHMAAGGHEMLFYLLTRRSKWIADWVDRSVTTGTSSQAKGGGTHGGAGG